MAEDLSAYRHPMFAQRNNVHDAILFAHTLLNTLQGNDRVVGYTALYVVLNTIIPPKLKEEYGDQEMIEDSDPEWAGDE